MITKTHEHTAIECQSVLNEKKENLYIINILFPKMRRKKAQEKKLRKDVGNICAHTLKK